MHRGHVDLHALAGAPGDDGAAGGVHLHHASLSHGQGEAEVGVEDPSHITHRVDRIVMNHGAPQALSAGTRLLQDLRFGDGQRGAHATRVTASRQYEVGDPPVTFPKTTDD